MTKPMSLTGFARRVEYIKAHRKDKKHSESAAVARKLSRQLREVLCDEQDNLNAGTPPLHYPLSLGRRQGTGGHDPQRYGSALLFPAVLPEGQSPGEDQRGVRRLCGVYPERLLLIGDGANLSGTRTAGSYIADESRRIFPWRNT